MCSKAGRSCWRSVDTDGDGLSDYRETLLTTDPTESDTDGDGIADAAEQSGSTDPRYRDTDDDGLSDGTEQEGETSPTDPDVDNDGLPDGAERYSDQLSGADPLRHDVFVEVDYVRGRQFSPSQRRALIDLFETAPTTNPDGSTGISLHLTVSDQVPPRENFDPTDLSEYRRRYMNDTCGGQVYAVLVSDAKRAGDDVDGFAGGNSFVSRGSGDTSTFLHELGHVKGLSPGIEGVDSRSVPMSVYPSVMNYNAPPDFQNYSAGANGAGDHDDWSKISDSGVGGYGYDLFPYTDDCSRTTD